MPALPSGTVTFLFTDIEGSTKLWEQYPEAMQLALARHDALLREVIEHHNGHIFKTVGDAFCAAFATAPEALLAALTAQQTLQAESWEEIGTLRVRMALHTGAAEERDQDYFGPALNRVARLQSIGYGGQVLISEVARGLVRASLPAGTSLKDLGAHRLKDLSAPEHVWQLCHTDLSSEFPRLNSIDPIRTNLPIQATSFIGRENEIGDITSLLERTRLLTLTGAGGCGKTRLALQVAASLIEEYPDGVWLVELAPLSNPHLVPQTVATVIGIREQADTPLLQTLINSLQPKNLLLVLDDCEHLLSSISQLAEAFLRSCAQVKIMVTSRERLRVLGEQTYRVPSLSLPDLKQPAHPEHLIHSEAICLFVDRATMSQVDFAVTTKNASAVSSVCHHLDGIPLALELAAARVGAMTVQEIEGRLSSRFRLLRGGSRTALPRHQTLRALIDWSYDLLNSSERLLLNRLSVFRGGWNSGAAEKVCAGEEIDEWEVLDHLTSLVDKSLIVAEPQQASTRYRMLETVRQYALEKLQESGQREALQARHLACFRALAEKAGPQLWGPEQAMWNERLWAEHDNLQAALEWCLEEARGRDATADGEKGERQEWIDISSISLAGVLAPLWWGYGGYVSVGRTYLAEALERSGTRSNTLERARALDWAGSLAWVQGDYKVARALHEEGLTIFRELGDKGGIALSLCSLGNVDYFQGDYEEARALLEQSLALSRGLGNSQGVIAKALRVMGDVAYEQGDYKAAQPMLEESLAIFRELGNDVNIAWTLYSLGDVVCAQGDYETARALYEQGLTIFQEWRNTSGIAHALKRFGNMALLQREYGLARAQFEQSLAIFEDWRDRHNVANTLSGLGKVAMAREDFRSARSRLAQSLVLRRELGDKRGITESLQAFANLAALEGQPDRAARFGGAAEELRQAIGSSLVPHDRVETENNLTAVREAQGELAFEVVWAEGRAMTMEQAMDYALGEEP